MWLSMRATTGQAARTARAIGAWSVKVNQARRSRETADDADAPGDERPSPTARFTRRATRWSLAIGAIASARCACLSPAPARSTAGVSFAKSSARSSRTNGQLYLLAGEQAVRVLDRDAIADGEARRGATEDIRRCRELLEAIDPSTADLEYRRAAKRGVAASHETCAVDSRARRSTRREARVERGRRARVHSGLRREETHR